jgi:hypothetical protein
MYNLRWSANFSERKFCVGAQIFRNMKQSLQSWSNVIDPNRGIQ